MTVCLAAKPSKNSPQRPHKRHKRKGSKGATNRHYGSIYPVQCSSREERRIQEILLALVIFASCCKNRPI